MTHNREFNVRSERIHALVQTLEQANDPELHATAMELLQCVMELHGAGLDRILRTLDEIPDGERATKKLLDDDLVASLLLLHDLHPDDIETRVQHALQSVRSTLESHGCEAELLAVEGGCVQLRLHSNGGGCGSTATTMKNTLQDAVSEAAPDAARVEIETAQRVPASQLITIGSSDEQPGGKHRHGTTAHYA